MHIDLSKYRGLSIRSFDMQELNGDDSIAAAARGVAGGGTTTTSAFLANIQHRNALIADAITHVNGEQVVRPFVEWTKWSLRTQEFVIEVFDHMNTVSADDLKDFRKTVLGTGTPAPVVST